MPCSRSLWDATVCFLCPILQRAISHLTVYKMANLLIYPLGFTHRERVFILRIKAAVHLAVDGIFSLCFAAGVWRSEWND